MCRTLIFKISNRKTKRPQKTERAQPKRYREIRKAESCKPLDRVLQESEWSTV